MMKRMVMAGMVLLMAMVMGGNLFAQQGRVDWTARVRTDIQFNFSPKQLDENGEEIDFPGIAFYEDNDGGAYSWNTTGELLVWYGKDLVSMWGIISYRQGWGFETKYNLSYDNDRSGSMGGKFQIGSRFDNGGGSGFNMFQINRISMYGWWQAWNKRVLMEMNPFGAVEDEWDSVWKTPAYLFDEEDYSKPGPRDEVAYFDDNIDVFFRLQMKNVIDNLNFGFSLPHFGKLNNLKWGYNSKEVDGQPVYWESYDIFTRANIGFKYSDYGYGFAGGFKFDPDKAQRTYLGGEYKILDQRLGIRADFKWNNIGASSDKLSDLDMGQGIVYNDGPLNVLFTLYEKELFYNDNKNVELQAKGQVKYVIIGRRLLGRMRVYYYTGVGEDNAKYSKVELEPGIFWAMGPQGVTDDLDNYSGMSARFNYQIGTNANESKINKIMLFVGFRWSK